MNMNDYQEAALKTAVFPDNAGLIYCTLQLASEAGEVAGKTAKILRGDYQTAAERIAVWAEIKLELGDVLWYLAVLAHLHGSPLADIAELNLAKLHARAEAGTLKGSGDHR